MPRGEIHVELFVNYADDEKLADVSRGARLLYVDALCLAKRTLNDGVLTQSQVEKLAFPDSPAKARRQAAELVDSGAWAKDGGRYLIPGFLKRNKSRAQVEVMLAEKAKAGAIGNHKRWHTDGDSDPKCDYCRDPKLLAECDPKSSQGAKRSGSPETETETETVRTSLGNPPNPNSRKLTRGDLGLATR